VKLNKTLRRHEDIFYIYYGLVNRYIIKTINYSMNLILAYAKLKLMIL
jgi:hypothetical protein